MVDGGLKVKYFLHKHNDLSSDPKLSVKICVCCTSHPSLGSRDWGAQRSLSSRFSEKFCLRNKVKNNR